MGGNRRRRKTLDRTKLGWGGREGARTSKGVLGRAYFRSILSDELNCKKNVFAKYVASLIESIFRIHFI